MFHRHERSGSKNLERKDVMKASWAALVISAAGVAALAIAAAGSQTAHAASGSWNSQAAAAYLDGRLEWWLQWPNAGRDHETTCVSCHTVLPYALARPALRRALGQPDLAPPERAMVAGVIKRVTLWNEVEPFYPDQTRGLPKSSESRGTEAVLNALVLAARDAATGTLSGDARQALARMWALQFKAGDLKGAWAWLNFHYEPWESNDGASYGAALAALAAGMAPGAYAAGPDIRDQVKTLSEYLQRRIDAETLFNRATALWASTKLSGLLTAAQRDAIVEATIAAQQNDGGWSLPTLGPWKRTDGTALDTGSDGYATGLMTLALRQSGSPRAGVPVKRGLAWLANHQDPATGMWRAASLNKQRDPATDIGKFMSDAATAYAVLALTDTAAAQEF
jgi:squalene-hopene/tetraprenyl-beta-curcumene cyclase